MSNEIELYSKIGNPIEAAEKMGSMFAKSGLFGIEKTETGMVLALACMAERKSPFDIVRTYHIVENKLAMRSDAMLAQFRQRGGKVQWKRFDADAAIGLWSFEGKETEIGFTMEDAKKMEVIRPRSGWTKAPDAMLRARCIAKAIRMICPEVIAGYLSVEEISDDTDAAPREINLGPTTAAEASAQPAAKKERKAKTTEQPAIDVPITVVPDAPKPPEQAPTVPPPGTTPKTVEKPAEKAPESNGRFVVTTKEDGTLTAETLAKIMSIVPDEKQAKALEFFKKRNWMVGDNLQTLKADKAQLVIDKTDIFLKQI